MNMSVHPGLTQANPSEPKQTQAHLLEPNLEGILGAVFLNVSISLPSFGSEVPEISVPVLFMPTVRYDMLLVVDMMRHGGGAGGGRLRRFSYLLSP